MERTNALRLQLQIKPRAPVRHKKQDPGPDSRSFVAPRTPQSHKFSKDTHNPKFASEGRPKSQDFKPANVIQKGKEATKPFNQEFKRPMPKASATKSSPPQKTRQANGEPKPKTYAQVTHPSGKAKQSVQAANTTKNTKLANPTQNSKPSTPTVSNQSSKQSSQTTKVPAQNTKTTTQEQTTVKKTSPQTKPTAPNKPTASANNATQKAAQTAQKVTPSKKAAANGAVQKTEQKNSTQKAVESDKAKSAQATSPKNKKNEEVKAQPEDKVSPSKIEQEMADGATVDFTSQEKRELDPLHEQVLDEELQDIMIQVWQELPDNPEDEDERLAVDKLRNELGDDLRRVLGLNVTKRLLNVFNNLFVKIHFTCRPQMGCLTDFLKKYNINKFKRIDKDANVFAAEVMCIEDFDNICFNKELTCGEAKVKVTPCYKYTQCPQNLKTIYDNASYYDDKSQEPIETIKYEGDDMSDDFETESSDKNLVDIKKIDDSKTFEPEEANVEIQDSDLEDYMDIEENDLEGDEELDDEDILALMAEGVVVDECSGSDDEK